MRKCIDKARQYCTENISVSVNESYKGEHPLIVLGTFRVVKQELLQV